MSMFPKPMLIPYFDLNGTPETNLLDLSKYPNACLETEKGFIGLETLYESFMNETPLSLDNRGFTGDFKPCNQFPYMGWARYAPQKNGNLVTYSWNDTGKDFLKLKSNEKLLQAVRTKCKKCFVALVDSGKSKLTLLVNVNKVIYSINIPKNHSLSYILKVEKGNGGLIIQSLNKAVEYIEFGLSAKNIPIDYWTWGLSKGQLIFNGKNPMKSIRSYPDFYFYWKPIKEQWKYDFELDIKQNYPFQFRTDLLYLYKDMNIIQVGICEPFSGNEDYLMIAAHQSLDDDYLDEIRNLITENIPQTLIDHARRIVGV